MTHTRQTLIALIVLATFFGILVWAALPSGPTPMRLG